MNTSGLTVYLFPQTLTKGVKGKARGVPIALAVVRNSAEAFGIRRRLRNLRSAASGSSNFSKAKLGETGN